MEVQAAVAGRPVEVSIAALDKPRIGYAPVSAPDKIVQRRQQAVGADLEHAAIVEPSKRGCPVEKTVPALHQCRLRILAVGAPEPEYQVEDARGTDRGDPEHGAVTTRPFCLGGAIEVAIETLDESRLGISAINSAIELEERREHASRSDQKYRAVVVRPPEKCCSVEIAISAQRQPGLGSCAVGSTGKTVQCRQYACRTDLEYRAGTVGAASGRRSVEVAVGTLDEAGQRIAAVSTREAMQRSEHAVGSDLEDGPDSVRPTQEGRPVKLYNEVNVPAVVILKTVPVSLGPPREVVP